jgi:phage terminase small subunit
MARKTEVGQALGLLVRHPSTTLPEPPCELGKHGRDLWNGIVRDYEFGDRGSIETLAQACAAADRAATFAARIKRDGITIPNQSGGFRDHPLIRHELAARAFVVSALARLGLDLEPTKLANRPGGLRTA